MNKCQHNQEYPVKHPSGSIYCLTCGRKLADSTFVGVETEIIPVKRTNWSRETIKKALDEAVPPVYHNIDELINRPSITVSK